MANKKPRRKTFEPASPLIKLCNLFGILVPENPKVIYLDAEIFRSQRPYLKIVFRNQKMADTFYQALKKRGAQLKRKAIKLGRYEQGTEAGPTYIVWIEFKTEEQMSFNLSDVRMLIFNYWLLRYSRDPCQIAPIPHNPVP